MKSWLILIKDLKSSIVNNNNNNNNKYGREEVYRLVNDSLNKDITREAFELILNSMTENHQLTSMLLVNGNVCLYRKNLVRLVMIKLIKIILTLQKSLICLNQVSWMILID